MTMTFNGTPRASGQDLCDIDCKVQLLRKILKNWEVLARRNKTDISSSPF